MAERWGFEPPLEVGSYNVVADFPCPSPKCYTARMHLKSATSKKVKHHVRHKRADGLGQAELLVRFGHSREHFCDPECVRA